jgi:hypothetical protein
MLWAVFLGASAESLGGLGEAADGRRAGVGEVVVVVGAETAIVLAAGSSSEGPLTDLRLGARDGYRLVVVSVVGAVVVDVVGKAAVVVGSGWCCCWLGMVASMTWGDWKKGAWACIGAGRARSRGLMTGLRDGFDGGHELKGGHPKRLSGSGESSESQAVHASVVGKPKELADRAGESGDSGDAESDVKSTPKSSVSKMDSGEKSEYVCFENVSDAGRE